MRSYSRKRAAKGATGGRALGKRQLSCSFRPCGEGHFRWERSLSSCATKSEDRLQPSLFTRLQAVEAELRAMKDLLAELKVNQDGLRRDRDEWRWRAERLLADRERGAFWRWRRRADAAFDIVTASLCELTVDLRTRLAEIRLSRNELGQPADAWFNRAEQLTTDRPKMEGRLTWLGRVRKATQPVSRRSSF